MLAADLTVAPDGFIISASPFLWNLLWLEEGFLNDVNRAAVENFRDTALSMTLLDLMARLPEGSKEQLSEKIPFSGTFYVIRASRVRIHKNGEFFLFKFNLSAESMDVVEQ